MKRFYKDVSVVAAEGGFGILLDGKPVKTPARASLAVPTRDLADALADEWRGQGDDIAPAAMLLTKLANTAIDHTPPHRDEAVAELLSYAQTDLLCYRVEQPAELAARQAREWDPWLLWAARSHGAELAVTFGTVVAAQPARAIVALAHALQGRDDFALVGVLTATRILGSLVLALALSDGHLTAHNAFEISALDERYQAEKWGVDDAAELRARRLEKELESAARFIALARS